MPTSSIATLSTATAERFGSELLRVPYSRGEIPSAACLLPNHIDEYIGWPNLDYHISTQLHTVTADFESLSSELIEPPDLYLFTAWSAIPLVETVRGYLTEKGIVDGFRADYIKMNRFMSDRYPTDPDHPYHLDEISRLACLFAEVSPSHVCIVEEWVASGRTLNAAGRLIERAGGPITTAIRGKWFADADSGEIDKNTLSVPYADIMYDLGVKAAKLV
jgi:hypothetical protein